MENEVQPNIPPVQPLSQIPVSAPTSPSINWAKIITFSILGLIVIAGAVFVGIQIGKNQTSNQEPSAIQPTASPTQITTKPTTQPSTNLTPNPNTEWKTYNDPTYKYSVEYPNLWKASTGDNGLTTNFTQTSSPDFISITIHDNPNSTEIHQWLIDKSIVPDPNNIATHIQEEDIVVSGIKSVKVTTPVNGGQFSVYIPKGDRVYSIYNNIDPNAQSWQENYDQNLTVMNQMVSTFKITN